MEKQEQTSAEAEVVKQVEGLEEEEATLRLRKGRTVRKESESSESDDDGDDADSVEVKDGDIEHEARQEMDANGAQSEGLILEDEQRVEGAAYEVLGNGTGPINGGHKSDEVLGNGSGSINGGHKSDNLVFYGKVEGVSSAPEYDVEEKIVIDRGHSKANGSSFVFDAENNFDSITSNVKAEDLELEHPSNSKLQESEFFVEESIQSYQNSSEIEKVEDDLEVTDYDVEGVLRKQNTHDLYCPNCKSCITKRVILRKRKRTVRISDEEVKRNKVEDHHPEEAAINESQVLTVDDNDDGHDSEPFLFKCLSCFTFFIPIGFRERRVKETVQSSQQPSNTRKNWFFPSMFPANKLQTTEQGSSVQTDAQNSQTSLSQTTTHTSKGLSGTTVTNVNLDVESHIIPSSSEGKGEVTAANGLDSTTVKTKDVSVGQLKSYTSDQLHESLVIKKAHNNKENSSSVETFLNGSGVTTNGVVEEHAEGKLKSQSPSMTTLEESQKPNMTSETGTEAVLIPSLISVHRDADNDGKISISMAVPQEQQQDFRATIVTESIFDGKSSDMKDRESGLLYHAEASQHITTKTQFHVHSDETLKVDSISTLTNASAGQITIDVHPPQPAQGIIAPSDTSMQPSTQVSIGGRERSSDQAREEYQIEIVKSIVYGGLAESITSLSVVSSAAGGGAKTLNILALGMANLIGGLFILCHNIWELRSDNIVEVANQVSDIQVPRRRDRYREILGRRENFVLHFIVSLTSYLVFGLVLPVAYGFSFRKSDDMELKLLAVAASSLVCICMLAIGRAYVQRPPRPYIKSVATFVILGFFVSGVSYAAGVLVERLLEKLGVFDDSGSVANLLVAETAVGSKTWAFY